MSEPFKFKLADFARRQAYIIGYASAQGLEYIEDIEDHLNSFKEGLLWLGFQEGVDDI